MSVTRTSQLYRLPASPAKSKLIALSLAALGAVALLAQPVAAEVFEEAHPFSYYIDSPTWSSNYEYTYDMPLFDTVGGTRTLTAFRVDYVYNNTYSYTFHDNMTANWVGCENNWTYTWRSTRNGVQWLPLDQTSGLFTNGSGVGGVDAPYTPGFGPLQATVGMRHSESWGDASLLATMIGSGTVPVICTQSLSALTIAPPRRWPPQAPVNLRVFDPNLITTTVDRLTMEFTLTYLYTPEPASLSLLGLGLLLVLRRR